MSELPDELAALMPPPRPTVTLITDIERDYQEFYLKLITLLGEIIALAGDPGVDHGELRRTPGKAGRRWTKSFPWDVAARKLFENLV